jgi:hypothetical protein
LSPVGAVVRANEEPSAVLAEELRSEPDDEGDRELHGPESHGEKTSADEHGERERRAAE